ncbi:MAG: hypothetical protein K2X27_06100 [Candidatus Obscuribacterales bacterium]|nr:hypothetical protein [Candidatus Obscuribacterales bacterium]
MIVVKHQYFSRRDRQSRAGGKTPAAAKVVAVGRALAHIKYIQHRPGEDRGDGGRELFSDLEDNLDGKKVRKAVREQEDSKVVAHKLTLAPEINPEDKKAFTREIMHRLGSEKGLDLEWMATAHNNTNHHHIHVVVLGKDKNGKNVRFDKDDYNRIKEYGDRYLERHHPYELEKSRQERERKERERMEARQKERETARAERIREGLELPWLHKKIVREQLEPFEQWKKQQEEKERAADGEKGKEGEKEPEKPYFQDTIEAAGKEWSRENTLKELRELNEYLWDHSDERIDIKEYKKLVRWMKDKERLAEKDKQTEKPGKDGPAKEESSVQGVQKPGRDKDSFDWKGDKYSKNDSYERLSGLAKELRENKKERLPVDEYQRLRGWIEYRDRERFSGVMEKELQQQIKQDGKRGADQIEHGYRWVDPLQQQVMGNPVIGVFMAGANIANTVVSWIDMRDNRDRLKEAGDELESAKLDKHQDYVKRDKPEDREVIDKLDRAIEENKEARRERAEEKKRKEQEQERKHDSFRYDPWGQY